MNNFKKRLRSKEFWTGLIGVSGLVAQYVCKEFGLSFDVVGLNVLLTAILTFAAGLGVFVNPTTKGIKD